MTTATVTAPLCRNFINGRWVESRSGQTIERRNPANLKEVTSVAPLSTREEVREAVAAAQAAFPAWRDTPAPVRGKILARAAARVKIRKHKNELLKSKNRFARRAGEMAEWLIRHLRITQRRRK